MHYADGYSQVIAVLAPRSMQIYDPTKRSDAMVAAAATLCTTASIHHVHSWMKTNLINVIDQNMIRLLGEVSVSELGSVAKPSDDDLCVFLPTEYINTLQLMLKDWQRVRTAAEVAIQLPRLSHVLSTCVRSKEFGADIVLLLCQLTVAIITVAPILFPPGIVPVSLLGLYITL